MTNLSVSNLTNIFQAIPNSAMDDEALNVPLKINFIITIIVNSVTCPFTFALNVLVIMAVNRRPRLHTYANILLACLAVTDALTGLLVQPTYIIRGIFQLLGGINTDIVRTLNNFFLTVVSFSSALHLMLVTCERLIAIKYTMAYPHLVTAQNIKVAVTSSWLFALFLAVLRWPLSNMLFNESVAETFREMIVLIVLTSCVVFMTTSYAILYMEAAHQKNKIKAQQLPREDVERFVKERKALKTTVYVVSAVLLCLSPGALSKVVFIITGKKSALLVPWFIMTVNFNSLLNPLIYCWRQKEIRQFVFRMSSPAVAAVN